MDREKFAYTLENYVVNEDNPDWQNAPGWMRSECVTENANGYPTALSFYEGKWYMIGSGQGPCLLATEDDEDMIKER